jgi:hypothetical protein
MPALRLRRQCLLDIDGSGAVPSTVAVNRRAAATKTASPGGLAGNPIHLKMVEMVLVSSTKQLGRVLPVMSGQGNESQTQEDQTS